MDRQARTSDTVLVNINQAVSLLRYHSGVQYMYICLYGGWGGEDENDRQTIYPCSRKRHFMKSGDFNSMGFQSVSRL
jgi:hypothetical protein